MKGSALLPVLIAGVVPFIVLFLLVVTPGLGLVAWRPPTLWSDKLGPPSSNSGATLIVSDSSGAFVQTYQNSSAFGHGVEGEALVLNKYDFQGTLTWTHLIGNASNTTVNGMSLGSDGLYLVEQNYLDKFDLNGDHVWTVQLGTGIRAETLVANSTGVFVAGFADHPLTNQSFTGEVLFVRQYDSSGNLIWTSEFSNVNLTGASLSVFAGLSGVFTLFIGTDMALIS